VSVALIKKAMRNFLIDPEPEVLCIKGKWGTGKTRAWEDAVKQAISAKEITKYAYVSLFGINNASDIIQAVFANTTDFSLIDGDRQLPNSLGGWKIGDVLKKLKAGVGFVAEHATIPHIAGLGGVARALLSNLVADTVVCIDDFERKNTNVSVNEIMGTIAQLRDARKCRVVLILNEDTLSESELAEFKCYSEKVINSSFQFDPTPTESATIAFPNNDYLSTELREACTQLEITNIRIMHKIDRYARRLMELLKDIDPDVLKNVVRSLVVIVWVSVASKADGAPSLEFISKNRFSLLLDRHKKEPTADELRWHLLLNKYGFLDFDEFSVLLVEDIKNGFFSDDKILSGADKYLKDIQAARAREALKAAWGPFHGSFDSNAAEVAKSLFDGCLMHIKYLSPSNLSAAVKVLKDIGFEESAHQLLNSFIEESDTDFDFELSADLFGSLVDEPDVINAFNKKAATKQKALPTPMEAASMLYEDRFLTEAEETLSKLSVDDFVALFKETKGANQMVLVNGCLAFRKISNASERQRHITETAKAALLKIGKESALNVHRMKKYNIVVDFS